MGFEMQTTRQRILEILKEKNQATVEELSAELDLTSVTVRHHLDVLRGEGLVGAPDVLRRSGPGRPQYVYELTPAAAVHFPKNYHNLADLMLEEIRQRVSPTELEAIIQGVAERMAAEAPSRGSGRSRSEILNDAVQYLNEHGYVARWEKTPAGEYVMRTCNCPYERVALLHQEICKMDADLMGELVGADSERMSHMANGDTSCSFVVRFEESIEPDTPLNN
jgi:predicted ArsR family transcriptional regulator